MKKISPPNWAKNARIDPLGWRHPKTGELLVCRRFTEEQIEAYNGTVMEADNGGNIEGLGGEAEVQDGGPNQMEPVVIGSESHQNEFAPEEDVETTVDSGDVDETSVIPEDPITPDPVAEEEGARIVELEAMSRSDLHELAVSMKLKVSTRTKKDDLITAILEAE